MDLVLMEERVLILVETVLALTSGKETSVK